MNQQDKAVVEQLYRAILGRDGDDSGIRSATEFLSGRPDRDGAMVDLVGAYLSSDEYRRRMAGDLDLFREIVGLKGDREINGLPIRHIVSLGTHCLTSALLKQFGLRRYSLPFDWLFSSPSAIVHCLEDGFRTFLDPRHYDSITGIREGDEPGAHHSFYLKKHKVGGMFAHRDPTMPDDYAYIGRTVARFNRVMALPDAKLFVMVARPHRKSEKSFRALSRIINSITRNSALLCIQLRKPTLQVGQRSMRLLKAYGDHQLLEFIPSSNELGVKFDDPLDNLAVMQLIYQFKLQLDGGVD